MINRPQIFQYNETSILIKFEEDINENLLNLLLQLRKNILQDNTKQILQVINTYDSLLVIYTRTINNFYEAKTELLDQLKHVNVENKKETETKRIPVCYDENFGWDLGLLSEELNLSISEIIEKHTAKLYTVYFIGFLPGFPYLGGLDSSLFHRRKSEPRRQIPVGSVGIADQQTGIYPTDSPGGWQIIGRSPLQLFDKNHSDQPCFLQAGDKVKFESISKDEFEYIQSKAKNKAL